MIELAPGVSVAEDELVYRASRSGGPGGQNVNKVATRIELTLDVGSSPTLGEDVRARLVAGLGTRLDASGRLRVVSSAGRTQGENRRRALERLKALIVGALRPPKKRIPTKPTRGARERRLQAKRVQSEKKRERRDRPSND